jgi:hypothetical protein
LAIFPTTHAPVAGAAPGCLLRRLHPGRLGAHLRRARTIPPGEHSILVRTCDGLPIRNRRNGHGHQLSGAYPRAFPALSRADARAMLRGSVWLAS